MTKRRIGLILCAMGCVLLAWLWIGAVKFPIAFNYGFGENPSIVGSASGGQVRLQIKWYKPGGISLGSRIDIVPSSAFSGKKTVWFAPAPYFRAVEPNRTDIIYNIGVPAWMPLCSFVGVLGACSVCSRLRSRPSRKDIRRSDPTAPT